MRYLNSYIQQQLVICILLTNTLSVHFPLIFKNMWHAIILIHSFISGMHHSDCVVPSVSRVDDSESRQLLHLGRGYWISGPAE